MGVSNRSISRTFDAQLDLALNHQRQTPHVAEYDAALRLDCRPPRRGMALLEVARMGKTQAPLLRHCRTDYSEGYRKVNSHGQLLSCATS
jgi:hypothetical protein